MSLERHIEYGLEYSTDIEYENLYSWCIREIDDEGKQLGRDLIPWVWGGFFLAEHIFYRCDITGERVEDDADTPRRDFTLDESIRTRCKPFSGWGDPPRYKMMGCSRVIENIDVVLHKSEEELTASCHVIPSFEGGIDFHERTIPDTISFDIWLPETMFDNIAMLIKRDNVGDLIFDFRDVDGFYSGWTPDSKTDEIKVLGALEAHKFDLLEKLEPIVRTAGKVGKFSIHTGTKNYSTELINNIEDETEDDDYPMCDEEPSNFVPHDESSERLVSLMGGLRLPLWLSFAALLLIAFQLV